MLVIPIAQDLTTTDYSTFKIKFKVSVKLPTNLIGKTVSVTAFIMDAANFQTFGKSAAITTLSVSKPSGQADSQATSLVSFGKDPTASTESAKGVGIYSTPFCLQEGTNADTDLGGTAGDHYNSNCGVTSDFKVKQIAGAKTNVLPLMNALEINWALPYEIPSDRTQADIVCKTEITTGGGNAKAKYNNDPLKIMQSSMITKGFGTANCFYMGAQAAADNGEHLFRCLNTGKLAKSANLQLAFQFHITNAGKTFPLGDATTTPTNNRVNLKALTLSCELKINTWGSATTSTVLWYQSKFTTQIDGNTQASKSGHW
jgi:hypothetical protein